MVELGMRRSCLSRPFALTCGRVPQFRRIYIVVTNDQYVNTSEAAPVLNISVPTVKRRCATGLYFGAFRSGRGWLIPRASLPIEHGEPAPVSRPGARRDPILDELDTYPPAITIARASAFLRMSEYAVINMLASGALKEIRCVRIVRVSTPSIRRLLVGDN